MKAKSVAVSMSAVSLTEKQTQFNALIGHCSHSHTCLKLFFPFLVARSTCRKWNSALLVKYPVKSGGANSRCGPKTCYSISINFKSKPFSSVLNCVISSVTPFAIREVAVRCNRFALQASNKNPFTCALNRQLLQLKLSEWCHFEVTSRASPTSDLSRWYIAELP